MKSNSQKKWPLQTHKPWVSSAFSNPTVFICHRDTQKIRNFYSKIESSKEAMWSWAERTLLCFGEAADVLCELSVLLNFYLWNYIVNFINYITCTECPKNDTRFSEGLKDSWEARSSMKRDNVPEREAWVSNAGSVREGIPFSKHVKHQILHRSLSPYTSCHIVLFLGGITND